MGACQCIWPGRCLKMEIFPEFFPESGKSQRRVRSRLLPPPYSLVSVLSLCRAGIMTQEFSCLRLIRGWYSALKVRYSKRNFSKIPICLKRRFAW